MLRKFLLVGLFVTIEPGSITQITLATIVTAVFLLVQLQAKPYKNPSDDYLASSASFAMLMIFICSVPFPTAPLYLPLLNVYLAALHSYVRLPPQIIYKYVELTDAKDIVEKMSLEQRQVHAGACALSGALSRAHIVCVCRHELVRFCAGLRRPVSPPLARSSPLRTWRACGRGCACRDSGYH